MSFASKHKKGSVFDINIEEYTYKTLRELGEGAVCILEGLFINTKGIFDDHPVAIVKGGFLVDLPAHLTQEVKEMISDEEDVQTIKEGHAGFKVETYQAKDYGNRLCYSVAWIDV